MRVDSIPGWTVPRLLFVSVPVWALLGPPVNRPLLVQGAIHGFFPLALNLQAIGLWAGLVGLSLCHAAIVACGQRVHLRPRLLTAAAPHGTLIGRHRVRYGADK